VLFFYANIHGVSLDTLTILWYDGEKIPSLFLFRYIRDVSLDSLTGSWHNGEKISFSGSSGIFLYGFPQTLWTHASNLAGSGENVNNFLHYSTEKKHAESH